MGDSIEVLWTENSQYYPVTVTEIANIGKQLVVYDDADVEVLHLNQELSVIQTCSLVQLQLAPNWKLINR